MPAMIGPRHPRQVWQARFAVVGSLVLAAMAAGQEPAPATRAILDTAPESATIALAVPSLRGLAESCDALARRLTAAGVLSENAWNDGVARLGAFAGITGSVKLLDIATTLGIDPDAPAGLFVDLGPTGANARRAIDFLNGTAPETSALPPLAERWSRMGCPAIALTVSCAGPQRAEATVASRMAAWGAPANEGDGLHLYDDAGGFALTGAHLTMGNYAPLIREAAARHAVSTPCRYGTPECPARGANEIAGPVRIDRIMSLLPDVSPVFVRCLDNISETEARAWGGRFLETSRVYGGEDPALFTLAIEDGHCEARVLADLNRHRDLAATVGEARPLHLLTRIPAGTKCVWAFRFNGSDRAEARKWLASLAPNNPRDSGVDTFDTLASALNDEVAVGLFDDAGETRLFLMATIASRDTCEPALARIAPLVPLKDSPLFTWAVSPSTTFLVALAGDTCAMATIDPAKPEAFAERFQSQESARAIETLLPGFDTATPTLGVVAIDLDLANDVPPMVKNALGLSESTVMGLRRFGAAFRNIRAAKCVRGVWLESSLAIDPR